MLNLEKEQRIERTAGKEEKRKRKNIKKRKEIHKEITSRFHCNKYKYI